MTDIVRLVESIDDVPTVEETDVILEELRRLPRTPENIKLMDDLLEFRSLLGAAE
ncbi:hypothetical protein [Parafrankia discariae]|uniref:hypothetical protein n=1 Tax=Parafrankia discariae TaxID=365528 RepID=UPI00037A4567|nr:hypothetical protein [Parafrankia discariae]